MSLCQDSVWLCRHWKAENNRFIYLFIFGLRIELAKEEEHEPASAVMPDLQVFLFVRYHSTLTLVLQQINKIKTNKGSPVCRPAVMCIYSWNEGVGWRWVG